MSRFAFRDIARPDGELGPEEYTVDLETVENTEVTPHADPGRVNLKIRYNTGKAPDEGVTSEAEARQFVEALTAFHACTA